MSTRVTTRCRSLKATRLRLTRPIQDLQKQQTKRSPITRASFYRSTADHFDGRA
jgi:hypothetical protein